MINKNNKKFCVYEHLFPNGKRYIGITSKNPEARWENGNGYHQKTQPVMYNAIRKYGWENIKHNILFDNLTEEEAKEKEKELIQEYNTFIDEEIIFTDIRERVLGWEYKGQIFKNLKELADYLNIKKGKLWSYLKNPHWKSAQKFLPLKDIHKIEYK